MRRIEIIHLRLNKISDFEPVKNQLKPILETAQKETAQIVKLYHRPEIQGDLCVMLGTDSGNTASLTRELGMNLTASLKEFGRVDHMIWVEI